MLQLVHRPTIRHVLQSLLRQSLVPVDLCVTRIKTNFNSSQSLPNENKETQLDQASVKVITFRYAHKIVRQMKYTTSCVAEDLGKLTP